MQYFYTHHASDGLQALSFGFGIEHLLLQIAANQYSGVSRDTWPNLLRVSALSRLAIHQSHPLVYQSSIALRLARTVQWSPQQVAQRIAAGKVLAHHLHEGSFGPAVDWLIPHVSIAHQGEWVQVCVTASGVAQWLQSLADGVATTALRTPSDHKPTEVDFRATHAYARCCSLLRLASEQGLLEQTDVVSTDCSDAEAIAAANPITQPGGAPIPWLASHRLRAASAAQQPLLQTLIQTLDDVAKRAIAPRSNALPLACAKGASSIAHAFEAFHQDCRPLRNLGLTDLDGASTNSPQLILQVQSELGLIKATQQTLARLLTAAGIIPPSLL